MMLYKSIVIVYAFVMAACAAGHDADDIFGVRDRLLDRSLKMWHPHPADLQNTVLGKSQMSASLPNKMSSVRPLPVRARAHAANTYRLRPPRWSTGLTAIYASGSDDEATFDDPFDEWFDGVGMNDRSEFFFRRAQIKKMGLDQLSSTNLELGIRPAVRNDAQQIANLINLDGRQVPAGLDRQAMITSAQTGAWLAGDADSEGTLGFLVAEDMNKTNWADGKSPLLGAIRVLRPYLVEPPAAGQTSDIGFATFQAGVDILAVIPEKDGGGLRELMLKAAEKSLVRAAGSLLSKATITGRSQVLRIVVSGIPEEQVLATASWERKALRAFYRNRGYANLPDQSKRNWWELPKTTNMFYRDLDVGLFGRPVAAKDD